MKHGTAEVVSEWKLARIRQSIHLACFRAERVAAIFNPLEYFAS